MLKNVALPFPIFSSNPVSGTNSTTSAISNITYHDSVALSYSWTGPITGTFDIQGSVDYNPGTPISGGAFNAGTWVSIPAKDVNNASPITNGSGSSKILVNMNQLAFPWIKTVYTNTSASGLLSGYFMAKSLG